MKGFSMFLAFLLAFLFFVLVTPQWFPGLVMIRVFFSVVMAAIIVLVAFGIIDMVLPSEKKEDHHH